MTLCLYIWPRACRSAGVKTSGNQTSAGVALDEAPRRGNSNPAGITPTTVTGRRSMAIVDPIAERPPKRRVDRPWLMIATFDWA